MNCDLKSIVVLGRGSKKIRNLSSHRGQLKRSLLVIVFARMLVRCLIGIDYCIIGFFVFNMDSLFAVVHEVVP